MDTLEERDRFRVIRGSLKGIPASLDALRAEAIEQDNFVRRIGSSSNHGGRLSNQWRRGFDSTVECSKRGAERSWMNLFVVISTRLKVVEAAFLSSLRT